MASYTQTNGGSASQLTILGLPAELRNSIYFLVAAGNTRPLLVSRLMQLEAQRTLLPPDSRDNVTLENRLNSAVGLHPLSQTCRQLRDEFQLVFLHNSAPTHRLIINNFDVAQTEFVANFLREHRIVDLWQDRVRRYVYALGVVGRIEVEFRGDSDIVKSAEALYTTSSHRASFEKNPTGFPPSTGPGPEAQPSAWPFTIYILSLPFDVVRQTCLLDRQLKLSQRYSWKRPAEFSVASQVSYAMSTLLLMNGGRGAKKQFA